MKFTIKSVAPLYDKPPQILSFILALDVAGIASGWEPLGRIW